MRKAQRGDLVEWTIEFRRDIPGRPLIDPDEVFFQVQRGSLPPDASITYTGSSTPGVGTLWRVSQGRYRTWVDATEAAGLYVPKAWSTGNGQAAAPPDIVEVIDSPF